MKVLRLEIETCNDCPYLNDHKYGEEISCNKTGKYFKLAEDDWTDEQMCDIKIPSWCPL